MICHTLNAQAKFTPKINYALTNISLVQFSSKRTANYGSSFEGLRTWVCVCVCVLWEDGGVVDSLQSQKEIFEILFGVNNFQLWSK